MKIQRAHALLFATLLLWSPSEARATLFPFTGTLEITTSVGTDPGPVQLVSVAVSGTANITGGVVMIPAGAISVQIPNLSGFSGTLVNGPGSFSAGGAGPGSTCPLIDIQEICITGGGFGGAMVLAAVRQAGQELVVWGAGGSNLGTTTNASIMRLESARLWTEGNAAAWHYIPETDPTPFLISKDGTFRGLPSTFTGTGGAGLSFVTPMMVTADISLLSAHNVRGVARLTIDFGPPTVPSGGAGVLAILLAVLGVLQLRRQRSSSTGRASTP